MSAGQQRATSGKGMPGKPLAQPTSRSHWWKRSREPRIPARKAPKADPEPGHPRALSASRVLPASLPGPAHARFTVADYTEVFCNRQRLRSTLGYRTSRRGTHRIPGHSNRCLINYPRSGPRSLT